MKYKDIVNLFPNLSKLMKNKMVLRFARCTPEIKAEIRHYLETEEFPVYQKTVFIEGNDITLSVRSLVNHYNMTVLDAYLFIDDFLQPDASKQELLNSLISLRVGEAHPQFDVAYLQANVDPEVRMYAERMSERLEQEAKATEEEAIAIENKDF